jgi:hypothetical protein
MSAEQGGLVHNPGDTSPVEGSDMGSFVTSVITWSDTQSCAPGDSPNADPEESARASLILNRAGVRIMALEDGATIGVWSDLDGLEIRSALRTIGLDRLPVRYLDGARAPMRYKVRRVEGEPVPMCVLAEMERSAAEPWAVRERMLAKTSAGAK